MEILLLILVVNKPNMKTLAITFSLLVSICAMGGQPKGDLKTFNPIQVPCTTIKEKAFKASLKDRKMARVYIRANSRVKKELHFIVKSQTKIA